MLRPWRDRERIPEVLTGDGDGLMKVAASLVSIAASRLLPLEKPGLLPFGPQLAARPADIQNMDMRKEAA